MSYKGIFKPKNPNKYVGDPSNIVYRSLWERKFMLFCDTNDNVIKWCSEEVVIPYLSPIDGKYHRYFVDFLVEMKTKEGLKTFLIEIKPKRQVQGPKLGKRVTKKQLVEINEFAKNQAKWKAAEEFCADRRWTFQVLTEDNLGI